MRTDPHPSLLSNIAPMTSPESISIHSKLQQVQQQWTPKVIAQVNENLVKIAKLQGDFIWHQHDDTDEMFLVVSGELNLDFRDAASDPNVTTRTLREGEMLVVPKGVQHRPYAEEECHVIMIELTGVRNTGDVGGPRTAAIDDWL